MRMPVNRPTTQQFASRTYSQMNLVKKPFNQRSKAVKEFKLTRKETITIEPTFRIGNTDYPQKFVTLATNLFKDLANKIGEYVVTLHDSKVISLPECFETFYVSEVFVRDRDTIQVNYKSKSDPMMLMQTTYNRQDGASKKKLTFVVSVGKLHSAGQYIVSSIIHSGVCFQTEVVAPELEPLQKLLPIVSMFLNDRQILNDFL